MTHKGSIPFLGNASMTVGCCVSLGFCLWTPLPGCPLSESQISLPFPFLSSALSTLLVLWGNPHFVHVSCVEICTLLAAFVCTHPTLCVGLLGMIYLFKHESSSPSPQGRVNQSHALTMPSKYKIPWPRSLTHAGG